MEWPESIKRKADALNDRVVELLKKTPVSVNNATAFAEWLAEHESRRQAGGGPDAHHQSARRPGMVYPAH